MLEPVLSLTAQIISRFFLGFGDEDHHRLL